MRRGTRVALGLLALALLAPAGASAAGKAAMPVGFTFALRATHGYSMLVFAGDDRKTGAGKVELLVGRHRNLAAYEAPATVTAESIEADLGRLGRISLRLQPLGFQETAHDCDGKPLRYEATNLVGRSGSSSSRFSGFSAAPRSAASLPARGSPVPSSTLAITDTRRCR